MFSILNTRFLTGKQPARMCKILISLPQFFHHLWRRFSRASYLIDDVRLKSMYSDDVGYRIALLLRQPVRLRICNRKD